jgi:hypothetical protein
MYLLLETGGRLLLESSGALLLEASPSAASPLYFVVPRRRR